MNNRRDRTAAAIFLITLGVAAFGVFLGLLRPVDYESGSLAALWSYALLLAISMAFCCLVLAAAVLDMFCRYCRRKAEQADRMAGPACNNCGKPIAKDDRLFMVRFDGSYRALCESCYKGEY